MYVCVCSTEVYVIIDYTKHRKFNCGQRVYTHVFSLLIIHSLSKEGGLVQGPRDAVWLHPSVCLCSTFFCANVLFVEWSASRSPRKHSTG